MADNDDDRGGIEFNITERPYTLAYIIAAMERNFPQQTLSEMYLLYADDGKVIIGVLEDTPTKPN